MAYTHSTPTTKSNGLAILIRPTIACPARYCAAPFHKGSRTAGGDLRPAITLRILHPYK